MNAPRYIKQILSYDNKVKFYNMKSLKNLLVITFLITFTLFACDSDETQDPSEEMISSLIGTWELKTNSGYTHTHVTFTKDGTFSYTSTEVPDYEEHGDYKIIDDLLYQLFSDEEDWGMSKILLLNSDTLTIQDLDYDGVTLQGIPHAYQRVK